ncbi:zinc-binding dehydrogenase [Streptomyces sp. MJM1172]|uniref:zinc-binding dehydrogenase n=1 Tax=Streptomyces sp. MJM1172 TaxID=1703926 RepID=UPI0009A1F7BA
MWWGPCPPFQPPPGAPRDSPEGIAARLPAPDPGAAGPPRTPPPAFGADAVVNHRRTPDWSRSVRELTDGLGVDLVVEAGGPDTIEQSVRVSALYGQIVLLTTGTAERSGIEISHAAYASSLATVRRVFVGSRSRFEDMNRAVSVHGLRPVIDRVLPFEEAHRAYREYAAGGAFGKIVIGIGGADGS